MIRCHESFSTGATSTELGFSAGYTATSGGRFSGSGRLTLSQSNATYTLPFSGSKIGVHMSILSASLPTGWTTVLGLREGATVHLNFVFDSSGRLNVQRNGSAISGGIGTKVFQTGIWYGIEIWAEIHDTAGIVKVWVDGDPTPDIDVSSQDTRNGGTGVISVLHTQNLTGATHWVGDLVVFDETGSYNNTAPLGDCRVEWKQPDGNGNSSQLVGSDADSTDNYLLVDETGPSTADYVESSTPAEKDTYTHAALSATSGAVLCVGMRLYAVKTDAGTRQIAPVYRHSGSEVDGATITLASNYIPYGASETQETKPGGGAWSISDVNGAEFGLKIVA